MTKEIKLSFIGEHLHHSYVYLHGTSIKVVNNLAGQQLLAFPTRMQVIFLEILINPSMIHCNYDNNIISGSSFIVDPPNHDIFVFVTYPLIACLHMQKISHDDEKKRRWFKLYENWLRIAQSRHFQLYENWLRNIEESIGSLWKMKWFLAPHICFISHSYLCPSR